MQIFYLTTLKESLLLVLHLCNKIPIDWYSSKSSPVGCATNSTEFTSMKISVEQIIANQIELHYLESHIDGPTHLFGDNKSVIDTFALP
jgi:hypothetical protein